jgi:hypothetical protein
LERKHKEDTMFPRFQRAAVIAAISFLATGCGEAPREAVPASRAAVSTRPSSPVTPAKSSAAVTTAPVAFVPAAAFRGGTYEPPHLENDFTLLKHFGVTSATVTLPRDARRVSFRAKPRLTPGEALPIVDITLEPVAGPKGTVYVLFPGTIVTKDDTHTTSAVIPKGAYRIQLGYVRHTKLGDPAAVRPHVEFYGVTFD